ncbi:phage minor head protein [Xanthobacteraceae bacterium Astr-EGSB]|uniref:PBECR2 nuclease fold domain-containing protein n=1 Tax=Astrobacterium formosum TaxID=3069710 RepID=UPI0027B0E1E6|nr:phage minor head protein [Xanthobacteraceae bacterium Astr-EGSB]
MRFCPNCGGVALAAAEAVPFAVKPREAIDFLRRKVDVPTRAWTDIWEGMHSQAFVVAGARSSALLADFHEAVNRNVDEGRTIEQFRKDFDRIVDDHGWDYKGGRNWRSRVIFDPNLRMAYSAGRWAQIQRVKQTRPFLRYVAVMDGRTRPLHRGWHDTVLHVDDPWWETHYPPNGWYCRCTVMSLNERDLKRYGLKVSDRAPAIEMVERTINTPTGPRTLLVPEGIDPGFAYNPGIAGFGRGAESLALERHGDWRSLSAPGQPTGDLPPLPHDRAPVAPLRGSATNEADLRAALREALGGDELIVADPIGARVRLGQAIVDHLVADPSRRDGRERYFPLMPSLVSDPAEVWVGWAQNAVSGRVALRRRYVRLMDLGGGRTIGLVADADAGEWSGMTFFRGSGNKLAANLRRGLLVYRRS